MISFLRCALLTAPAIFLATVCAAEGVSSPLAGTWTFDAAHSTELSPWKNYDLTIAISGDRVTIHQRLAWGRRYFEDTLDLDTTRAETIVPIELWPDNRHLGAYASSDRPKRVHTAWLDDRRILRLSTDLVLSTQQGSREINILSDYKVSANGQQLTLTELRSTRNRPIVYVFNRVEAPAK